MNTYPGILADYRAGHSVEQIAAGLSSRGFWVPVESVRRALQQMGAALPEHPVYVKPSPERDAEIYALRQSGLTLQAIGDRFGLSREGVRRVVYHLNRKMSARHERARRR